MFSVSWMFHQRQNILSKLIWGYYMQKRPKFRLAPLIITNSSPWIGVVFILLSFPPTHPCLQEAVWPEHGHLLQGRGLPVVDWARLHPVRPQQWWAGTSLLILGYPSWWTSQQLIEVTSWAYRANKHACHPCSQTLPFMNKLHSASNKRLEHFMLQYI